MGTNIGAMNMADLLNFKTQTEQAAGNKRNIRAYIQANNDLKEINKELEKRQIEQENAFTANAYETLLNVSKSVIGIDTQNKTGYNLETTEDTKKSIEEDAAILKQYDSAYQTLLSSQIGLEGQCESFEYPDLEKIGNSGDAQKALDKVQKQIERIKLLIVNAQNAVEILKKEKEVANQQLKAREVEYERTQEEIKKIKAQIEQNEKTAKQQSESYEKNSEKMIEQYIQEYQNKNLQAAGVDMQEYVQSKMQSYQYPSSVQDLYNQNEQLIGVMNMKGQQLEMIGKAMDSLNTKISQIDKNIEIQNGKLDDYNKNLQVATQYRDGCVKIRDEWKKAERKKKKKRGFGGFLRGIGNAVKNIAKGIVKAVKSVIKGVAGFVGNTLKFVGKHLGDVTKSLGLGDEIVEGAMSFAGNAAELVGSTCTFDAKEMKQNYKDMQANAENAVMNGVVRLTNKALKSAGKHLGDAASFVTGGLVSDHAIESATGVITNTISAGGEYFVGDFKEAGKYLEKASKEGLNAGVAVIGNALGTIAPGMVDSLVGGQFGKFDAKGIAESEIDSILNQACSVGGPLSGIDSQIRAEIKSQLMAEFNKKYQEQINKYSKQVKDGKFDVNNLSKLESQITQEITASIKEKAVAILSKGSLADKVSNSLVKTYTNDAHFEINIILSQYSSMLNLLSDEEKAQLKQQLYAVSDPIVEKNIRAQYTEENVRKAVNGEDLNIDEIGNQTMKEVTDAINKQLPQILSQGSYVDTAAGKLTAQVMEQADSQMTPLYEMAQAGIISKEQVNTIREDIKKSVEETVKNELKNTLASGDLNNLDNTQQSIQNQVESIITAKINEALPKLAKDASSNITTSIMVEVDKEIEKLKKQAATFGFNADEKAAEVRAEIEKTVQVKVDAKINSIIKDGNTENININGIKEELEAEIKADLTKKAQNIIKEFLTDSNKNNSSDNTSSFLDNIFGNIVSEDLLGLSNVIDVVEAEVKNKPLELLG